MAPAVLTGFRAFPGVSENPAQALVGYLSGTPQALPQGTRLALLDVDYRSVGPAIDALLADPPAALVLTGYSHLAEGVTLEMQASALCAPDKPDAGGFVPQPAQGPTLQTGIDLTRLQPLVERHAPCRISHDAGQYLCNFAYRHALSRAVDHGLPTQILFVHLPALSGTPLAAQSAASLPMQAMAAALARIVHALAGHSPPE